MRISFGGPLDLTLRPFDRASAVVLITGLLGVLVILLGGCGNSYDAPPPQPVGSPPSLDDGETVVAVQLSEEQARELSIATKPVSITDDAATVTMPGEVVPSPEAFAIVSAPISGRIARITAHEGEPVRRGQAVAYIESLEFASILGNVVETKAQVDLDRSTVDRYTMLVEEGIIPRARLIEAEADAKRSEAMFRAANARVTALGLGADAVASLSQSDRPLLPVTTPVSGLIDRHGIDLGQAVSAYEEMLTVVSNTEVLVRGMASPEQATLLKPGDAVTITSTSGGTMSVNSTITSIGPAVDPDARAVVVNIRTKPDGLRPGQSVRVHVETQATAEVLLLPIAALSYNGDKAVVFVEAAPNTFEQRIVELGPARTNDVPVLSGLSAGDVVAVTNVYDLKALARFEQYGEE